MPSSDCTTQRRPVNGLTPADLRVGSMQLSELFTGRWTRAARRNRRRARLAATVAYDSFLQRYAVPLETTIAVVGVCDRNTCCTDGGPICDGSCGTVSACGCKVVRHPAHPEPVWGTDEIRGAELHAISVLTTTR